MYFILLRYYKIINSVLLFATIYLFFLPEILLFTSFLPPEITECRYLVTTGNPCPFCGVTRDINNIKKNEAVVNNISVYIYIFCLFEFSLRLVLIFKQKLISRKVFVIDAIFHLFVFLFFLYLIVERFLDVSM